MKNFSGKQYELTLCATTKIQAFILLVPKNCSCEVNASKLQQHETCYGSAKTGKAVK